MKSGDLIAFSGDKWLSVLISLATYGHYSHVGIIADHKEKPLLWESTTLSNIPCVIQGKMVKGVQAVNLEDRIEAYQGHVWHYPLYRSLYLFESTRLGQYLLDRIGTPYDQIGAVRSGGFGFSWFLSFLYKEDLSKVFCSELVTAAYREIGILPTTHVSRWSPNVLIRYLRRNGILLDPVRLK